MIPEFDLESVYMLEITPLVKQILAICQRERIPFVTTFCCTNESDGASFITSGSGFGRGISTIYQILTLLDAVELEAVPGGKA